jgi:cell division control protein 24
LLKKSSPVDYPHYEELKAGSAAVKRVTDKINTAQRRAENLQTIQNLTARVDDWKGHHVSQFGELLLDDIFIVTKTEVDREYHIFLFERIILCCHEDNTSAAGGRNKKVGKSNSLLKNPQANGPLVSGLSATGGSKKTALLLKGRIYLNNITEAKVVSPGDLTFLSPYITSEFG